MITLKEISKPNSTSRKDQTIYEFYSGSKLIGKATYNPILYKSKLSLSVRHPNNSSFYKLWTSNWQGAGVTTTSKSTALKDFEKWYKYLTT
jgi:hypothetical protein